MKPGRALRSRPAQEFPACSPTSSFPSGPAGVSRVPSEPRIVRLKYALDDARARLIRVIRKVEEIGQREKAPPRTVFVGSNALHWNGTKLTWNGVALTKCADDARVLAGFHVTEVIRWE